MKLSFTKHILYSGIATVTLLFTFLITGTPIFAQVINGYAEVTNISGSVLTLSNVDESDDTFENGAYIIIMQMQDDVIGANTSDNSSFGNLSSIASCGLYEVRYISSHTESSGTPTTITISGSLSNTYNTGSNEKVQIVTFPSFGSPDYTTTSNLSAKAWDGNTGGVLAFQVPGTLTLSHNLSVDGLGFRGASRNNDFSSTGCNGGANFRVSTGNNSADKGEGIYLSTSGTHAAGKAKILNGGGGGNSHNGGGGGGSNYTIGGDGGPGWPNCSPSAGGQGGIALSAHITANRIFMGGGGGSGEGNNGGPQNAGDGGGIILVKANTVQTTGSCGGINISSNGESVSSGSNNDGNSGGGAGGSIVFDVTTWSIAASCALTISANGGDGGDVTHGDIHGAGGGGGQGAVLYSSVEPTSNITTNTNPGQGGQNCNTCGSANNGGGVNGAGINDNTAGPLPVDLVHFEATPNQEEHTVQLLWITASEVNNDHFTIEKTKDLEHFDAVTVTPGKGTTNEKSTYKETDYHPYKGISYYRLAQTDYNGQSRYLNLKQVEFDLDKEFDVQLFPNPNNGQNMYLKIKSELTDEINILANDFLGKDHLIDFAVFNQGEYSTIVLEMDKKLAQGNYIISIQLGDRIVNHQFVVR